jgi:mono/diheme cytochrome c family protein
MSDGTNYMKYAVVGVLALGVGLVAWRNFGPSNQPGGSAQIVAAQQLSAAASLGKVAFDDNCAQCHGVNAAGTDQGPPLVHDYYNPGHHADGAFFVAVANGVRQHHWRFGNMPPQPRVTQDQTRMIVAYVRELQEANGIFYKPH